MRYRFYPDTILGSFVIYWPPNDSTLTLSMWIVPGTVDC